MGSVDPSLLPLPNGSSLNVGLISSSSIVAQKSQPTVLSNTLQRSPSNHCKPTARVSVRPTGRSYRRTHIPAEAIASLNLVAMFPTTGKRDRFLLAWIRRAKSRSKVQRPHARCRDAATVVGSWVKVAVYNYGSRLKPSFLFAWIRKARTLRPRSGLGWKSLWVTTETQGSGS